MKTLNLTPDLYRYVIEHNDLPVRELNELAAETSKLPGAIMQIAPEQGSFMHMLVKLINAKRILEVGCYTGYSAISMASALPTGGKLISLDIDPENTKIARKYFDRCGLNDRIDLRIAPALEQLQKIENDFGKDSFDLMFIDADKDSYPKYFEYGLRLLKPNGLMIVDNVLWSGAVVDPKDQAPMTKAIKAFNEMVLKDSRVEHCMLAVSDGLSLLRKK